MLPLKAASHRCKDRVMVTLAIQDFVLVLMQHFVQESTLKMILVLKASLRDNKA
jgi:hypothetical protein